jgi:hypothetical protein
MAAKIFISYRRDDAAALAGRVYDRLEREFGRDNLFRDIGRDWLDARDEDGNRRLDNPYDYVRIEISAALKRDIPVIPILIDGTRVPKADQLPDDLKALPLRG